MEVLVTGHKGFVGEYLAKALEAQGKKVTGFDIVDNNKDNIRYSHLIDSLIKNTKPDEIYHLAALTYVPETFDCPELTISTNTTGTVNVLEAIRKYSPKSKLLYVSTGDALSNSSPYTISKLASEYFCQLYHDLYRINVVIVRPSPHTGAGRPSQFAESSWAKQIVKIEKGEQKEIKHGNLGSLRSYLDVRDVVKAYLIAIDQKPGVYNICSNRRITMKQVLDMLISNAKCEIKTEIDSDLYRVTNHSPKIEANLPGWEPEIKIEDTLKELLNYWRKRVL